MPGDTHAEQVGSGFKPFALSFCRAVALALPDEALIRQDYAAMLCRQAAVYRSDGQEQQAEDLEAKAGGLWKE